MLYRSARPQKRLLIIVLALIAAALIGLRPSGSHAQTVTLEPSSPESEGDFGIAVDRVGDVTGDGYPDVVVGAQEEDFDWDGDGRVYLYEGNSGTEVASFTSPNSTLNGNFGGSVSYAGDLGGETTTPDVLIGASNEDLQDTNRAGAAYAFAPSGALIRTFTSPNLQDDGSFGGSVNHIDDLSGDGVPEVLIGAPRETVSSGGTDYARAGHLYVMSGATGEAIHTLSSQNPEEDGVFGVSAAAVGDVDGDAVPDVIVGANGEKVGSKDGAGRAYVFSGATGAHLHTLTSDDVQRSGSFGGSNSVAGVGDVNGDGLPDLAVAAGGEDGGESISGNVYLFSGDGSLLYAMPSPNPTFLGNFGTAIDGVPDVDDDGHDDFVVGAKSEGTNGNNAGLAYLFSGVDGSVIATLRSQNPEDNGTFGEDVAYAGDVDGDNIPDVVTGALEESVGGTGEAGRAYVHTGFYFFLEAESQKTVSSDGLVNFGATGVDVDFSEVTESGDVFAFRMSDAPRAVSDISESTVSDYRIALASVGVTFGSSTEIRFDVSSFGGISTPSAVTVYKRPEVGHGSFSSLSKTIDENGTPDDPSDDEIVVSTGSFSEFVFASDSNPLPVELAGFSGTTTEEGVQLTWQTASETNNAGFRVERRASEGEWEQIGRVDGTGTTTTDQAYRFVDSNLPYEADRLTYRLKQVDTDGTTALSDAITVERGTVTEVQLLGTFPNPARTRATVRFAIPDDLPTDAVTMRLYDMLGRQVRTVAGETETGRHELQLDLGDLSSGVYFLRLQASSQTRTQKLTVVQ